MRVVACTAWLAACAIPMPGTLRDTPDADEPAPRPAEASARLDALTRELAAHPTPDARRAELLYQIAVLELHSPTRRAQRNALAALNEVASIAPGYQSQEVAALSGVLRELIRLRHGLDASQAQVTDLRGELERQRAALRRVTESMMESDAPAAPGASRP